MTAHDAGAQPEGAGHGPDSLREALARYPPVVYVPCLRHVSDPADIQVVHNVTRDGRTALVVYSALDRLHRGMGEGQPWFVVPTPQLRGLYEVQPFDLVLLDVEVPEQARQPAGQ